MGVGVSTMYNRWIHPDVTPEPSTIPKFDPLYGFPEGRELKGKRKSLNNDILALFVL